MRRSDTEILRAILEVRHAMGDEATQADVAKTLECSASGLHRRLWKMEREGLITMAPLGLLPEALDHVAATVEYTVLLRVSGRQARTTAVKVVA